jgi:hypothetical protein
MLRSGAGGPEDFHRIPGSTILVLTIDQLQSEPLFRMPIELEIQDAMGSYRTRVEDSLRTQTIRLTIPRPPSRVILDPDDWILKSTIGGSDAPEPPTVSLQRGAPWPSPGAPPFRIDPLRPAESIEILRCEGAPHGFTHSGGRFGTAATMSEIFRPFLV